MTRVEAIAKAVSDLLRKHATEFNTMTAMESIVFEVRLKPRTTTVLNAFARPQLRQDYIRNGEVVG